MLRNNLKVKLCVLFRLMITIRCILSYNTFSMRSTNITGYFDKRPATYYFLRVTGDKNSNANPISSKDLQV